MKKIVIFFIVVMEISIAKDYFYYKNHHKVELIPQQTQENQKYLSFKTREGRVLGVSDKILVKSNDDQLLNTYLKQYKLSIVKMFPSHLYLLKVPNKNLTLDIANELNMKEGIVYAHPDFKKSRVLR